jgi:hypothetical protein
MVQQVTQQQPIALEALNVAEKIRVATEGTEATVKESIQSQQKTALAQQQVCFLIPFCLKLDDAHHTVISGLCPLLFPNPCFHFVCRVPLPTPILWALGPRYFTCAITLLLVHVPLLVF